MRIHSFRRVCVLVVMLVALSSCSLSNGQPSQASSASSTESVLPVTAQPPVVAGAAVLDPQKATIVLPLASYGMSGEDQQIVDAARAVLIWRCSEQTDSFSSEALANIRAWLAWDPVVSSRLYGSWSASFIAVHGWDGSDEESGLSVGPDDAPQACFQSEDYVSLGIVDTDTAPTDVSTVAMDLLRYSYQAYDEMTQDDRFKALVSLRAQCVQQQGYTTDDSNVRGVVTDDSWNEEQVLQAMLVEANCADNMNFTQQAADINAAYEQQIIDQHQAELVTIKNLADQRVATAHQILVDAKII